MFYSLSIFLQQIFLHQCNRLRTLSIGQHPHCWTFSSRKHSFIQKSYTREHCCKIKVCWSNLCPDITNMWARSSDAQTMRSMCIFTMSRQSATESGRYVCWSIAVRTSTQVEGCLHPDTGVVSAIPISVRWRTIALFHSDVHEVSYHLDTAKGPQ